MNYSDYFINNLLLFEPYCQDHHIHLLNQAAESRKNTGSNVYKKVYLYNQKTVA